MKTPVAILISGQGSNMAALIAACADPDYPARIVLVISNDPSAGGLAKASSAGIKTEIVDHRLYRNDRESHERAIDQALKTAGVRIVCLAGYMRILTPYLVGAWAGRMLNIHPSLLPAYPGLHTHERALAAGDSEHGCTVHLVSPGVDEGPILQQARVPVLPSDTPATLAARVLKEEHRLYPCALAAFIEAS